MSKSDTAEAPLTIWGCFVPSKSVDSIASMTLLISHLYGRKDVFMAKKDVFMAAKCQTFNSFIFGTPIITLDKLTRSENYQSWAESVDLWFIGNGCEDHLTTMDTSIPMAQN